MIVMADIKSVAARGLREPKLLTPDEIKLIAEYVAKEAHATSVEAAAAKKALHDPSSVTEEELKTLSGHVLGESSHIHHKS
jgi:hypothetical protein